jgi:hypothetical protein
MQDFLKKLSTYLPERRQQIVECSENSSLEHIIIHEDAIGKSVIYHGEDEEYKQNKCFSIRNAEKMEITLLSFDGCYVRDNSSIFPEYPKKCDCIFGWTGNVVFLEFKLNSKSTYLNVKFNLEKAVDQLADTINSVNKAMEPEASLQQREDLTVKAIISTPPKYPGRGTEIARLQIGFLEKYGIALFELNSYDTLA